MRIKAFGCPKKHSRKQEWVELNQITLMGLPGELRRIAKFLAKCADDIERHGRECGHSHLRDEPDLKPWPGDGFDVIVSPDAERLTALKAGSDGQR